MTMKKCFRLLLFLIGSGLVVLTVLTNKKTKQKIDGDLCCFLILKISKQKFINNKMVHHLTYNLLSKKVLWCINYCNAKS